MMHGNVATLFSTCSSFLADCASARRDLLIAADQPHGAELRILADIVDSNAETAFGRAHGFSTIRDIAEYRARVPIRTYDEHLPWLNRCIGGEANVLTADTPYMFLKTSGTTGRSKVIPQTKHWRQGYRGPAVYAQWAAYARYHPYLASGRYATLDLSWERNSPSEFVGNRPYQSITHRPEALAEGDWLPPWYDEPWFNFIGQEDTTYAERMYVKARHFVGKDLRCIVSVNPSTIVALINHIAANTDRLIRDVHDGTCLGAPGEFEPEPALAAELAAEALANGGRLAAGRMWPNLNLVACWRSASAALYSKQLTAEFPEAELLPFSTTGTEGIVTIPIDRHPTSGILAMNQGLYEFVPCSDPSEESVAADAETLSFDELEIGQIYHLVMTQANGLYRYNVGDLYKLAGRLGSVPRLEFVGRAGRVSSFTGEKLTEAQTVQAVQAALDRLAVEANVFTCCPVWGTPPRYTFIIEPKESSAVVQAHALAAELDLQLGKANDEYEGKRGSERLGAPSVLLVPTGTFQRYWDIRVSQGVSGSQLKHRWLQDNRQILDELQKLIAAAPIRELAPA